MNHLTIKSALAVALLAGGAWAVDPGLSVDDQPRDDAARQAHGTGATLTTVFAPRGRIGVTLGTIDDALGAHLQLDADEVVMLMSVIPGAAADKAGVQAFDIVTKIDGKTPVTQESLREAVRAKEAGETIRLTVLRAGETRDFDVAVEATELSGDVRIATPEVALQLNQMEADELAAEINALLEQARAKPDPETMRGVTELLRRRLAARSRIRAGAGMGTVYWDGPHEYQFDRQQWRELAPDQSSKWQFQREVEIHRDSDGRDIMFMRPERPTAPQVPGAALRERAEVGQQRIQRIEERLERIEKMLEQLLEAQKN